MNIVEYVTFMWLSRDTRLICVFHSNMQKQKLTVESTCYDISINFIQIILDEL